MIKETLTIRIGDDVISVIVKIIHLEQYLKDIGGNFISDLE